jgi:RsmE family RNA methyltransferase
MNLVLLRAEDFVAGSRLVRLDGRRLEHVRSVHRAQAGDELRVGVLNGQVGRGLVARVSEHELVLEVVLEHDPPAPLPVTLVLALPRPKTLRRVLQAVAAMGVKRLVLLNSWRVEKSYWKSPALAGARIERELMLGLEQGRDTVLPEVTFARLFAPFVKNELRALVGGTRALVAHPSAREACPYGPLGAVTLAIGPEGGFIEREIDTLVACGFTPISLGDRPLRVEHAVVAMLSRA